MTVSQNKMPLRSTGQSNVTAYLFIFIGIVAGYLFYSQTLQDRVLEVAPLPIREGDSLDQLKDKSFDFSVFDNVEYRNLRLFGEVPVNPGVTGRIDIFAPF
ncbi:MAG: hypothetical protein Q8Q06_01535 [bacterium]|nr:hypothetical protein [bacterium]